MPILNVSELNIVLSVLGAFIICYGFISVKIKDKWLLGEALPAVAVGIILGPIAAKFIDSERWGSAEAGQTPDITLGLTRIVIGVQLVIAGFQLPAKYQKMRWKEMTILMLPVMTVMWLCSTLCVLATIPKLTLLSALVIASTVTCTDPILSQAVAKGPFTDMYVHRDLREIISSEAGANDGFGFPFLMLAVFLIRHADIPGAGGHSESTLVARSEAEVGRLGGGVGVAMGQWFLETWLYTIILAVAIGVVVGLAAGKGLKFALNRKWVDSESYVLFPTAVGLWILGIGGILGTDDILACFVAGNVMNWDGQYLRETLERHDEVNSSMDVLLNFGGFMYVGMIIPWDEFHQPEVTGITYPRLFGLAFLILLFRRIPAILAMYKFMPKVVKNWKEAIFMGYFGPIGIGAVFYVEHTMHLFPKLGEGDTEETNLIRAARPVVYFLALFSIFVHGLSIPALNAIYKWYGVKPIQEDAVSIKRKSLRAPTPPNAVAGDDKTFIAYNRFSRPVFNEAELPTFYGQDVSRTQPPNYYIPRDKLNDSSNSFESGDRKPPRPSVDFYKRNTAIKFDDVKLKDESI
ncbi:Sodium/hydrogen exchanger family-domain-containing protein [Cladorrhinum sp. PSN259]|nr:Sodium/hydrogen exchanger family-domain-containing protein [Cladorrhinum sp. PSN259]